VHIVKALQVEGAKKSLTLELECPHIVRALKLYSRVSSGRITPLAHPKRGMTRHNVLGITRDSNESMRLCVAAQDVVDCDWVYILAFLVQECHMYWTIGGTS
jgi:acetone carboxylase gamma subunit